MFVSRCPINNNPALVYLMAWRLLGDKPLSEPMLTDICGTRVRWVKSAERVFTFYNFCRCFKIYWATTIKLQICWHRWTTLSSDEAIVCVCPIICNTWSNEVTLCRIILYPGTNQISRATVILDIWQFCAASRTVSRGPKLWWFWLEWELHLRITTSCVSMRIIRMLLMEYQSLKVQCNIEFHQLIISNILLWLMCGVDRKL